MFKAGDKVRIVNLGCNFLRHPTESRDVKNGDEVVITSVRDTPSGVQMVIWKPNKDGIFASRCDHAPSPKAVCNCPSHVLIWGHLPGCAFKH